VLRGDTLKEGYVLHLDGADHWTLSGFSVTNGEKGIMADRAAHNIVQGIDVHHIGHEGIHLRAFSTDNLVRGNLVHHTGLRKARYGEGLYIGSAHSNWCQHSGCKPDRSDRNRILDNRIGPEVTAEGVDLKEGTTSGVVSGNDFIGANMTGADSWVDVKGNGWQVKANRGNLSPRDGFQVHVEASGWGRGNQITGNQATWAPTASTASGSTTTPGARWSAATTTSAGPARTWPTSPVASTHEQRSSEHAGCGHRGWARRAGHGGVPGPHRP